MNSTQDTLNEDLQSALAQPGDYRKFLDLIDDLRSNGVSRYVALPQIIVCGDQSSGKSSVLNAVSTLQFEIKDNLCTRFAIEVILRNSLDTNFKVSITPGGERSQEERNKLENFGSKDAKLENIPQIISNAKKVMRVGTDGKAFSDDVLRIEASGPKQPNLTLVDLPGVIQSENRQQSIEDINLVRTLVKSYMANSRSIILAVISAKNDYANQIITRLAREVDPKGQRTLGIITKPDDLHAGSDSERSFVSLANNEEVMFRLGWHVLKNRDSRESEFTTEQRNDSEQKFFSQGIWKTFPSHRVGVASLIPRLSSILHHQISEALPDLILDVETGIEECEKRLSRLGSSRTTPDEIRLHLVGVSQEFSSIMKAAVDGVYTHDFFADSDSKVEIQKRLRAVIQDLLTQFSNEMLEHGHTVEIVDAENLQENNTRQITRTDFLESVGELFKQNKGRELPGLFNPMLIGELFLDQSKPWGEIIESYRILILKAVEDCMDLILKHITDRATRYGLRRDIFGPAKQRLSAEFQGKVDELMKPYLKRHPITYNSKFVKAILASRQKRMKKMLRPHLASLFPAQPPSSQPSSAGGPFNAGSRPASGVNSNFGGLFNNNTTNLETLLDALTRTSEKDSELHACSEAVDVMEAYYQLALKQVIDNFARLAVEACVEQLSSILTPAIIMKLSNDSCYAIGAEAETSRSERESATMKLKSLQSGLQILEMLKHERAASAHMWNGSESSRSPSPSPPQQSLEPSEAEYGDEYEDEYGDEEDGAED